MTTSLLAILPHEGTVRVSSDGLWLMVQSYPLDATDSADLLVPGYNLYNTLEDHDTYMQTRLLPRWLVQVNFQSCADSFLAHFPG